MQLEKSGTRYDPSGYSEIVRRDRPKFLKDGDFDDDDDGGGILMEHGREIQAKSVILPETLYIDMTTMWGRLKSQNQCVIC